VHKQRHFLITNQNCLKNVQRFMTIFSPQVTQGSVTEGGRKRYDYCKVWENEMDLEEMRYEYVDWN